jgi:hypothetical protein
VTTPKHGFDSNLAGYRVRIRMATVLNHPRNGIPGVCGCSVCEFYPDERWAERREREIGGFTLREGLVRYVRSASVDVEGLLVTVRQE